MDAVTGGRVPVVVADVVVGGRGRSRDLDRSRRLARSSSRSLEALRSNSFSLDFDLLPFFFFFALFLPFGEFVDELLDDELDDRLLGDNLALGKVCRLGSSEDRSLASDRRP